jgi:hypothetical protein
MQHAWREDECIWDFDGNAGRKDNHQEHLGIGEKIMLKWIIWR